MPFPFSTMIRANDERMAPGGQRGKASRRSANKRASAARRRNRR